VHHYEHASVRLHFFRVWDWQGEPQPQEGQQFAWQAPDQTSVEPMLPANGPILKSLQLPAVYAITCAHEIGVAAVASIGRWPGIRAGTGARTGHGPAAVTGFVCDVAAIVHARGGKVVVNADPDWLAGWPVDGVHLNGTRLRHLAQRPDFAWVGASVHSAEELQQAGRLVWITPCWPCPAHGQPPRRHAAGLARLCCGIGRWHPAAGVCAGRLERRI
jgi:8-oxo-dGTP diphosphatase